MAIKFAVSRADLTFESGFARPEFSIFRDTQGLLDRLFAHLQPHGLQLTDMRIERGPGTVGDFHVLCYLFNFLMALRIRADRIDGYCSQLPRDYVPKFGSAFVGAITAVRAHLPDLNFRSHALNVGLHGLLEGQSVREYLSKFAVDPPNGFGPLIGNGAVFYFGPEGDRMLSSVTLDASALVTDALYLRAYAAWNAKNVGVESLQALGEEFVQQVVSRLGLELQ